MARHNNAQRPKSWREALPLAQAIYATEEGRCGCCLHIVLDDGNLEDGHIDHCIERAAERGHAHCLVTAGLIRTMSMTQRGRLYAALCRSVV